MNQVGYYTAVKKNDHHLHPSKLMNVRSDVMCRRPDPQEHTQYKAIVTSLEDKRNQMTHCVEIPPYVKRYIYK